MKNTTAKLNPEAKVLTDVKPNNMDLVSVHIDRQMTDGGIRINGKLYVGNVKVSEEQAEDLLRIQEEYFETKKKLIEPNISVRMKSDFQKEALFLADPKQNEGKKGFTRDYGLLSRTEWEYCKPAFKEHLLEQRRQMFGY
jgi:hypothetical protein